MVEAYQSLRQQLELDRGIPYSPNWSAAADFLQIIVDACLRQKPSLIFECSSGLTTLMLARCCQINGAGQVISLENGPQYADATRNYLARYGLQDLASVWCAPLRSQSYDAGTYEWYSVAEMPDQPIDMLVIDGPPGFLCKHARYPALPACYPHLNHHSAIYLDDAAREDEQQIVSLWCDRYPGLSHEYVETERGCSILTFEKP